MSYKKSKLDLLVRVRYANPLPPPPCPPKLLDIPTNPARYAQPSFLNTLASNTPFPMIVDAECGMPLDLAQWESLWQADMDDSALNPDATKMPKLDPKDEMLAYDTVAGGPAFTNGQPGASTPSASGLAPVSWLRRTEYVSRGEGSSRSSGAERQVMEAPMDVSRAAQLRDIDASFAACNESFTLETLQHPNKPGVTAIESYEILPDIDLWPNQYDLFRFSERPGEKALDVNDPRLECAILRPMKSAHDSFLSYYLTSDDAAAERFKTTRFGVPPYEVPANEEETVFNFIRDYETTKVEQEVPNEFLLVIDEGTTLEEELNGIDGRPPVKPRKRGAYYKNIERKMFLKKKRQAGAEDYEDKWEVIRMTHATMSKEEEDEREELLAEVLDPDYLLRADADADGEVEMEDGTLRPIAIE